MEGIRAIDTQYKGFLFRSRLEARWAVYFDALGLRWTYEEQGYTLENGDWYLPDFFLTDAGMWAEVKSGPFPSDAISKVKLLCHGTRTDVVMLDGIPNTQNYWGFHYHEEYKMWDVQTRQPLGTPVPMVSVMGFLFQGPQEFWGGQKYVYQCRELKGPQRRGVWPTHLIGCLCSQCDTNGAVQQARSARFEHGQVGSPLKWVQH